MQILIVEDEPKSAALLKEFIQNQLEQDTTFKITDSIESTAEYLQKHSRKQPDLIFMDIQLADGISFEIFKKVVVMSPVIFCTAYEQYTLDAFKSNGIDYILKPFEEKDIAAALDKIKQLKKVMMMQENTIDKIINSLQTAPKSSNTSFLVRFREKMYPVPVKSIALISLENEIIYLYTFEKEKHPLFRTMEEIAEVINASQFFRLNRQMFVNREAILEIEPYFNRKIIVKLNIPVSEKIIVSRLKVHEFLSWIEKS
jgi:two-component system, LytTR family, response regulator